MFDTVRLRVWARILALRADEILRGGGGSGNYGHPGRPGEVGSAPNGGVIQGTQSKEMSEKAVADTKQHGGATIYVSGGAYRVPNEGYVVSTHPERSFAVDDYNKLSPEQMEQKMRSFVTKNSDLLKDRKYAAGLWVDKSGKAWHDVVRIVKDKQTAIKLGKQHNQIGIYGIKEDKVFNTGGTGE